MLREAAGNRSSNKDSMAIRNKSKANKKVSTSMVNQDDISVRDQPELIPFAPELNEDIERIAERCLLNSGTASKQRNEEVAETMFEAFVKEFDHLDLAGKLAWFDRKLRQHSDAELLLNSKSRNHAYEICLHRLLELRRTLTIEFESKKLANERRTVLLQTAVPSEPEGERTLDSTNRHADLTIDRAILLLDVVGGHRLKSADKEKLADVLAFLTGYKKESIRQRYSCINPESEKHKGLTVSGNKALQRDVEVISHFCDLIGLRSEVQKLSERLGIPDNF